MPVLVASRRRTRLSQVYPGALILDVTSKGAEPWVRLSPFYRMAGSRCRATRIEPRNRSKASGRR